MMTFFKIICIWISCIICLFGRLQLSTVEAATFEYYDDHEQLSYDLDTEQSKAKYDTRILTQQLLKAQKSSEATDVQIDKDVNYYNNNNNADNTLNAKADNVADDDDDDDDVANAAVNDDGDDDDDVSVEDAVYANSHHSAAGNGDSKFKNNEQQQQQRNADNDDDADDDDGDGDETMQPHERAASCYAGGHKYTHGQKIPRFDPCEVCLCMDGEIFCWWEKCNKKPHHSTMASSTERSHRRATHHAHTIEATTTARLKSTTAQASINQQQQQQHQQQHHERKQLQHEYSPYQTIAKNYHKNRKLTHQHQSKAEKNAKSINKKAQQQQQQQQNKLKLQNFIKQNIKQQQMKHQQLEQQQHKPTYAHEHKVEDEKMHNQQQQHQQHQQQQEQREQQEQEHAHHAHHRQHEIDFAHYASAKNKILNFPENLPSVLYSDYKTEEHEHLQHQHHQKHLKHQLMRQQQQQQQQSKHLHAPHRQQIENATATAFVAIKATTLESGSGSGSAAGGSGSGSGSGSGGGSTSTSSTEFENSYDAADTDSDILPEPPTKRPKYLPNAFSDIMPVAQVTTTITALTNSTEQAAAQSGNGLMATHNQTNETKQAKNTNNDVDNASGDDDAFHRWLTSTETNNNRSQILDARYDDDNDEDDFNNMTTAIMPGTAATTTVAGIATAGMHDSNNQNNVNNNSNNNANNNEANNENNNNNTLADDLKLIQSTGNAILRSTLNEYNNGGVINIDISLMTTEEDQQEQQQKQQQQQQQQDSNNAAQKAQLIAEMALQQQQQNTNCNNKTIKLASAECAGDSQTIIQANATTKAANFNSTTTGIGTDTASTIDSETQAEPVQRHCHVMGTIYNIGDVLPQDTGNCLQCVCAESYNKDDTPRVTCSPHNCPPLVLPDLLDATGY